MVPEEHKGRRSYSVNCLRTFKTGNDFDLALMEYCKKKGYVYASPEDETPENKQIQKFVEETYKHFLGISGDIRLATIGLDENDSKRIQILWSTDNNNVRITTFCGQTYAEDIDVDYTELAHEFSREFFGGLTWNYFEEPI